MLPDLEVLTDIVTTANSLCKSARSAAFRCCFGSQAHSAHGLMARPIQEPLQFKAKPWQTSAHLQQAPDSSGKIGLPAWSCCGWPVWVSLQARCTGLTMDGPLVYHIQDRLLCNTATTGASRLQPLMQLSMYMRCTASAGPLCCSWCTFLCTCAAELLQGLCAASDGAFYVHAPQSFCGASVLAQADGAGACARRDQVSIPPEPSAKATEISGRHYRPPSLQQWEHLLTSHTGLVWHHT